ncbi:MAG: putative Response Regulator [Nitrospira sp.]|jgi:DNA-binding response OmpR family regulator|nr:putative Response Regulator [Nitrospira sp.]
MPTSLIQAATILIVDDDPSTLLLCAKPLQEEGYTAIQASGSAEALRLYAEHPTGIHLVLTDIFLPPPGFQLSSDKNPYPRVNGLDMIERILEGKREIRIILMSGSPAADLRTRGLIRDGLPFLKKPFAGDALLDLVRLVLTGPPAMADSKKADRKPKDVEWFG